MSQQDNNASTRMEINGMPLYIKSHGEKGISYLYDIDTNEHVGYWCQKKGVYVMFSPYERILNNLKRSMREELRNSGGKLKELNEVEEAEEAEEVGSLYPTSTFVKFFVLMLIYIMCQKQFQAIYIDFIFAFAFTILYTKIVKTTLDLNL